jgi:L-rhamnose mutarotase
MRVALYSIVKSGQGADYDAAHERVPSDLVSSFARVGIREWTIWRSGDQLFHVVDCDDFVGAMNTLVDDPANQRWQAAIGPFIDHFITRGDGPQGMTLARIWDLADQKTHVTTTEPTKEDNRQLPQLI